MPDSPDPVGESVGTAFDNAWADTPTEVEETPAVEAPAVEAAPSAPATPRTPDGKFAPKTDAARPAPAVPEPGTPPADAPPPPDATDAPPVEGETPEPEVVYPEFEYTVNGRALNIPGSKVGEDGAFIPKAQMDRIAQTLIRGHMSGQREREHAQAVQAARTEGRAEVEKARRVLAAFGELTKDKAKLLEWAENLEKNRETLTLRAELDAVRAEKEQVGKQWTEHEETAAAQALVPQLQNGLRTVLGQHAAKPEFAGVDTQKLFERIMNRHFDQVFEQGEATENNPTGVIIDQGFIEDEMRYEAAVLARGRAEASKQSAAARVNQQVLRQAPPQKRAAPIAPKPATTTKPGSFQEAVADVFGDGWKEL